MELRDSGFNSDPSPSSNASSDLDEKSENANSEETQLSHTKATDEGGSEPFAADLGRLYQKSNLSSDVDEALEFRSSDMDLESGEGRSLSTPGTARLAASDNPELLTSVGSGPSVDVVSDSRGERPPSSNISPKEVASAKESLRKPANALRRGKWTVEEEAYVARVIQDFNSGFLDAPAGTTLRTYLSEKLQCDPMRITKKFTGDACIGKRVFHPAVRSPSNAAAIDKAQAELDGLERRWRRRLELQQRESAKKAAASAAAAAAAASGQVHSTAVPTLSSTGPQNVVARTASWLDRAKSALNEPATQTPDAEEASAIRSQMQEVQRLIHEGPIIQESSAGIPQMLDAPSGQQNVGSGNERADKRMRTAEDAEALVGFLRSVHASAASGDETF